MTPLRMALCSAHIKKKKRITPCYIIFKKKKSTCTGYERNNV